MVDGSRHLIDRASQGDPVAVEALLERYLPDLRSYLARRAEWAVRARESTEDLVQSCCRELIERLVDGRFHFQGEAQFRQWLYQAALLKLRDRGRHWKAERRDLRREVVLGGPDSERWSAALFHANDSSPSSQAARREQLELLEAAFSRLPERDRDILTLAHVEGLPHREIGQRLCVTPEHSRVLLSRAIARLARLADELGGQAGENCTPRPQ